MDFLSIFYPIFQDFCHFIQLWKITPFFYNNFFGFWGARKLLPPPMRAPLAVNLLNGAYIYYVIILSSLDI